jgi:hypothetical protein
MFSNEIGQQSGHQLHLFYTSLAVVGSDINHIFWDGTLHFNQWASNVVIPVPAGGNPATMVVGNQLHIFYRGSTGAINHIFYDGTFHFDDWTAAAKAPPAAGDPATMVVGNQMHIFYLGARQGPNVGGAINHIFYDGTFHFDDWTAAAKAPPAGSDPVTMVVGNEQHIFYRNFLGGPGGVINHIFWDGTFHFDQWAGAPPAPGPIAAGNPALMVVGNQLHMFYWCGRPNPPLPGPICHVFYDGTFHFENWTAAAKAPNATGDPATMLVGNQLHVFYPSGPRGGGPIGGGAICHIFYDGTFHYDEWTFAAGAPAVGLDLVTMVVGNEQHIFYSDANSADINHIFYDGTFHFDRLITPIGAPPPSGKPVLALVV